MNTTSTTLKNVDAALMYAAQGVPVFPFNATVKKPGAPARCACRKGAECGAIGKHPRIGGYVKAATTDRDQITEWFGLYKLRGVGAYLRGFLLVDLDPRNGLLDPYIWRKHYPCLPPDADHRDRPEGWWAPLLIPVAGGVRREDTVDLPGD